MKPGLRVCVWHKCYQDISVEDEYRVVLTPIFKTHFNRSEANKSLIHFARMHITDQTRAYNYTHAQTRTHMRAHLLIQEKRNDK